MVAYSPTPMPIVASKHQGGGRRKVLIVEDEPQIADLLVDILEMDGYETHAVATGAEAEPMFDELRPDLVLLDIILPDMDGLVLCSQFHARSPAPIIMLSGTKRLRDRVLSLRLGADDFIAKPFDVHELVARVEAVLRRSGARQSSAAPDPAQEGRTDAEPREEARRVAGTEATDSSAGARSVRAVVTVGPLMIDPRRRSVTIGGMPVHLTPTETRLLATLASEPEQVFSRKELAEMIWGYDSVGESRAVDVHIRRLRAKLEPFGDQAPPIVTVRGFGYKLTRERLEQAEDG